MAAFDEELAFGPPRKKTAAHEIGQPVDDLSASELAERIAMLRAEILRLEQAIAARQTTHAAATAFFKS